MSIIKVLICLIISSSVGISSAIALQMIGVPSDVAPLIGAGIAGATAGVSLPIALRSGRWRQNLD